MRSLLLHRIWQRHHVPPDEIYAKSEGQQAFIFASELIAMEAEAEQAEEAEKKNGGKSVRNPKIYKPTAT